MPETLKTTLREAELIRDGGEWAIGKDRFLPHTKGQTRGNPATQSHGPTPHDGMAAGPPIEAHNARHVRDDVAMTPIGKVL